MLEENNNFMPRINQKSKKIVRERIDVRTGRQASQRDRSRGKSSNTPYDLFERGEENISDDSNDFYQSNTSYRK